jgi:hypothetical protein
MKPDKLVIRKTLNVAKECNNCHEVTTLDQYFVECNYFFLSDKLYPVSVNLVFFGRCKCGEVNALSFSTGESVQNAMKKMLNLGKEQGFQKEDYVVPPAGTTKN